MKISNLFYIKCYDKQKNVATDNDSFDDLCSMYA